MTRRCALLALLVGLTACLLLPAQAFAQYRGRVGGFGSYGGYGQPAYSYGGYGSYGYPGYAYGSYGAWPANYYGGAYAGLTSPYSGYGGSLNYANPQPYAYSSPLNYYGGAYYTNPQPYNYSSPASYNSGYPTGVQASGYQSYQSSYPPTAQTTGAPDNSKRTVIHVHVPVDAQVLFDDTPTRQTGTERHFMTPPLDKSDYSYQVTARWMDNGKERRETRTVRVIPGQTVNLDLTRPDDQKANRPANTEAPQSKEKTPPEK